MEITASNASGGADGQSPESEQIEYTATKLQVQNSVSVKRSQDIYLGEETGGKGRQFRARFLVPGLVKYDYGVCLLTKENADRFIEGFTGCPVVIDHKNVTDKNAKDVSVGHIFSVWFDEKDGYYWCNGIITDKHAIELINQGYSVSCQYLITEYSDNTDNKLHNGNPYDKVIENGKPEHLAIVNNPRYEGAIIAVNSKDKEEKPFLDQFKDTLYEVLAEGIYDRLLAVNEDKWITKYDKEGKPYKIKIDGEDLSEELKQKLKDYKDLRNSYKKVISELKFEQLNLNNFYVTNKSRKGFSRQASDPMSIEMEEKNRKFNRIIQDMKNYLTTDKTEIPMEKIDEWETQLEETFFEVNSYSDAEEKSEKWAEALELQFDYIELNNKIKNGEYKDE